MLAGKEAVLFDLDGTLVDSMWMWKQIDIEYLGRFGIELPDNLQAEIAGMSFSETAQYFQRVFPEITDTIDEMKECWNRMAQEKYRHEVPLKPGVMEFLEELKRRDIKIGIATSNSCELVTEVLQSLGVRNRFDAVHTACEVAAGKPAPDIYLYVAEKLQTPPERCLVFEDIVMGIRAGKSAGMQVCAVRDEFSMYEEAQKIAEADYFIRNYREFNL
ncbi:MAG: HAD family phosphatase [Lachnospiraceae bacterium]|nr:HAD family phosphatase [Lachnospiraceae bacterium]